MKVECVFLFSFVFYGAMLWGDERFCILQIEQKFFNSVYVDQALASHDVSQSAWREVNRKLQERSYAVRELVQAKANALQSNPFVAPFRPHEAAKVLEEVLYEIFVSVLLEFNIENPYEMREMFNYIRQQQDGLFVACFGKEESVKKPIPLKKRNRTK